MLIKSGELNREKMNKIIIITLLFITQLILAQKRIDSADCHFDSYNNVKEIFLKNPNCNNYRDLKKLAICKRNTVQEFSIIYTAIQKSNCIQAYHDLFIYYRQLNFELSKKSTCNRDSLLLEYLDIDSRNLAVKSLLKAQIDKSIIAGYYYHGIYLKQDKKLAIKLLKETYNYEVSEISLIEELSQMKQQLTPCSN